MSNVFHSRCSLYSFLMGVQTCITPPPIAGNPSFSIPLSCPVVLLQQNEPRRQPQPPQLWRPQHQGDFHLEAWLLLLGRGRRLETLSDDIFKGTRLLPRKMMCEIVNECRQALQAIQTRQEWSWHLGHPASAEEGGSSWAAQAQRGLVLAPSPGPLWRWDANKDDLPFRYWGGLILAGGGRGSLSLSDLSNSQPWPTSRGPRHVGGRMHARHKNASSESEGYPSLLFP